MTETSHDFIGATSRKSVLKRPLYRVRQASLYSWAGCFESYLFKNPKDRFPHDVAQLIAFVTKRESFSGLTSPLLSPHQGLFTNKLSRVLRLWYFSSSVNSFFKRACGARCLIFGLTLCLFLYFVCANSEGSGEKAPMCRLAWAFAVCQCDKKRHFSHALAQITILESRQLFLKCCSVS